MPPRGQSDTLIPSRIPWITGVTNLDAVPVANGSDAVYAVDSGGGRWVRKMLVGANDILAEAIGLLFSWHLGIPTPDGAVCNEGGDMTWLSKFLVHTTHWSPSRAHLLDNPDDLGAILALDALIGNWDRHAGNLLLLSGVTIDQLSVFSIDVANAWVGTPSDIAKRGAESPSVERLAPGIPVDMVRDGATAAAEETKRMSPELITSFCREACLLAGSSEHDVLADALRKRCALAPHIVHEYLGKIEGRR